MNRVPSVFVVLSVLVIFYGAGSVRDQSGIWNSFSIKIFQFLDYSSGWVNILNRSRMLNFRRISLRTIWQNRSGTDLKYGTFSSISYKFWLECLVIVKILNEQFHIPDWFKIDLAPWCFTQIQNNMSQLCANSKQSETFWEEKRIWLCKFQFKDFAL